MKHEKQKFNKKNGGGKTNQIFLSQNNQFRGGFVFFIIFSWSIFCRIFLYHIQLLASDPLKVFMAGTWAQLKMLWCVNMVVQSEIGSLSCRIIHIYLHIYLYVFLFIIWHLVIAWFTMVLIFWSTSMQSVSSTPGNWSRQFQGGEPWRSVAEKWTKLLGPPSHQSWIGVVEPS